MLKNITKLEIAIENRVYQLLCDNDSPIPHIKEAICQFLKYAGNVEDYQKATQAQAAAAEAKAKAEAEAAAQKPQEAPTEPPKE